MKLSILAESGHRGNMHKLQQLLLLCCLGPDVNLGEKQIPGGFSLRGFADRRETQEPETAVAWLLAARPSRHKAGGYGPQGPGEKGCWLRRHEPMGVLKQALTSTSRSTSKRAPLPKKPKLPCGNMRNVSFKLDFCQFRDGNSWKILGKQASQQSLHSLENTIVCKNRAAISENRGKHGSLRACKIGKSRVKLTLAAQDT